MSQCGKFDYEYSAHVLLISQRGPGDATRGFASLMDLWMRTAAPLSKRKTIGQLTRAIKKIGGRWPAMHEKPFGRRRAPALDPNEGNKVSSGTIYSQNTVQR